MRSQTSVALLMAALASACGGPLNTGSSRPDASTEVEPGGCPNDYNQCGSGASAVCTDLRNDPEHCGACDKACAPGIACADGVCQRIVCGGRPLLAGTSITGTPTLDSAFLGATLADVNGDGQLDLVTWRTERPRRSPGSFEISLGQGWGLFQSPKNYLVGMGISRVHVLDVNHDGADDLFLVGSGLDDPNSESRNTGRGMPCSELWLGSADGNLTAGPEIPVEGCRLAMALADLSGDGHFDLVANSFEGEGFDVYLSDSTGNLRLSQTYAGASSFASFTVQDWNGDGSPDLISMGPSLQVRLNHGDGTFAEAMDYGILTTWPTVFSDFNRDGQMDLATTLWPDGFDVLLGLSGFRFTPAAHYQTPGHCDLVQPADMDGDGRLDLLCMSNDVFTGFLANPDGTFQATIPQRLAGTAGSDAFVVGDVTGDGRPDLVVADRHGPISLWENTCP